jgi:hypothetical protein
VSVNLRTVALVTGVIAILYGLGFLIVPGPILAVLDVQLPEEGLLVARFFGAHLMALGVIDVLARESLDAPAPQENARNAIVSGNVISSALSALLALWGVFGGLTNELGWGNVVLTALIAVAWTYTGFLRSSSGRAA